MNRNDANVSLSKAPAIMLSRELTKSDGRQ